MEEFESPNLIVAPPHMSHRFRPLSKQRDEIRILCLDRGVFSDLVSCTTVHAYLDTNPAYEALSYTWGDPGVTHPITLDGSCFQATINLVAALKRLRLGNDDRKLWVDALCINQEDGDERCRQVALMGRIYSNTTKGIMWLGDTVKELSSCPNAEVPIGNRPVIPHAYALESIDLIIRLSHGVHLDADEINPKLKQIHEKPIVTESLTMLLNMSWWQRIWTVQEVVLPQQVIFQCGDLEIPLETFDAAVRNYELHDERKCCHIQSDDKLPFEDLATKVNGIMMFRKEEMVENCETLVFALNTFSHRLSTDKRDKIYGLLGLLSDSALSSTVDYDLPYAEVYTKTAIELVRSCKNLLPLLRPGHSESDPALPSWVPNWGSNLKDPGDGASELEFFEDWNAAAGCPVIFGHTCQSTLSLMGFYVDQIVHCIPGVSDAKLNLENLTRITSQLPLNYPLGGTMLDAFTKLVHVHKSLAMLQPIYFITSHGLLGISDDKLACGDEVYILSGGNVPFVLRPVPNPQIPKRICQYISHSYVVGVMNGEFLQKEPAMHWVYLI